MKTIFDRIFESQISQLDLDMRFKSTFDQFSKKVEKSISEQLSEEVEEIQLQVNSLRAQLKQKDKKRHEL